MNGAAAGPQEQGREPLAPKPLKMSWRRKRAVGPKGPQSFYNSDIRRSPPPFTGSLPSSPRTAFAYLHLITESHTRAGPSQNP